MNNRQLPLCAALRLAAALSLLLACLPAQAHRLSLSGDSLVLAVPDSMAAGPVGGALVYNGLLPSGCQLVVAAYHDAKLKPSTVLERMDTTFIALRDYRLADKREEPFWDFTRRYVERFYESDARAGRIVTYTCFVADRAWCLAYVYTTDEQLAQFDAIVSSMEMPTLHRGLGLLWQLGDYAPLWLLAIAILTSVWGAASGFVDDTFLGYLKTALKVTALLAVLLVVPMRGYWASYLALLLVAFVWTFICGLFKTVLSLEWD